MRKFWLTGLTKINRIQAPHIDGRRGFLIYCFKTSSGAPPTETACVARTIDRNLRQVAVSANRDNPDMQLTNGDGSGHEYWVDQQAGFSPQDQTDLVQFLLSIDDDPAVLPDSVLKQVATVNK